MLCCTVVSGLGLGLIEMLMLSMLMLLLILLLMLSLSFVVAHGCGFGCDLLLYAACCMLLYVAYCSSDVVHRVVAGAQEEFVIVQAISDYARVRVRVRVRFRNKSCTPFQNIRTLNSEAFSFVK